eukprot:gb/GEZN01010456.1/.p1 GENE.gb/GEZN01010456.1/~~gb/GEZN01010456.1/.p1  ORF type:complete len:282 (+),score=70.46 gb/GEZN01010456.1/:71-916(+)
MENDHTRLRASHWPQSHWLTPELIDRAQYLKPCMKFLKIPEGDCQKVQGEAQQRHRESRPCYTLRKMSDDEGGGAMEEDTYVPASPGHEGDKPDMDDEGEGGAEGEDGEHYTQPPDLPLEEVEGEGEGELGEEEEEQEEGGQRDSLDQKHSEQEYDPDVEMETEGEQQGAQGGIEILPSSTLTEERGEDGMTDKERLQFRHRNHVTTPYMTKYEKARILGTRALQISMGAPILVELNKGEIDPLEIALKELKQKKMPIVVRRFLPDGSYEDWQASDLITDI